MHSTNPLNAPSTHFPWVTISLLAVAQIISWGSVFYSFTLFILPWNNTHGWPEVSITAGFSVALLSSAFMATSVGRMIDRGQGHKLMAAGSFSAALLFISLIYVQSLTFFFIIWVGFGFVIATTFYEPLFAVLVATLKTQSRKAVTLSTLLGGFAGSIFVPFTYWLISSFDWQTALLTLALINLCYCMPVHYFGVKKLSHRSKNDARRFETTEDAHHDAPCNDSRPIRTAIKLPSFWFLASCFICYAIIFSSVTVHLVHLLAEKGIDNKLVVTIFAFIGPSQVAGRVMMLLLERFKFNLIAIAVVSYALMLTGFFILIFMGSSFIFLVLFAIFYGMPNGIFTIIRAVSIPEYVSTKHYGALQGFLTFFVQIILAISPFVFALVVEVSGGYGVVKMIWVIATLAGFCSFLLAVYFSPLRRQAKHVT